MAWEVPRLNYSQVLIDPNAISRIGDAFVEAMEKRRKRKEDAEAAELLGRAGGEMDDALGQPARSDYSSILGIGVPAGRAGAPVGPVTSAPLPGPVARPGSPAGGAMAAAGRVPNYAARLGGLDIAPEQYRTAFLEAGQRNGVDPAFLARMARQESGFNPRGVSPAGAEGMMQIMPGTQGDLGLTDPYDAIQSIDGGARYMGQMEEQFGENQGLAAAAYNWGPGRMQRWLQAGADPSRVPRETLDYVERVTGQPLEQWVTNYRQSTPGTTAMAGDTAQPATGMPSKAGAIIGQPFETTAAGTNRAEAATWSSTA